jgi:hypothetical protein
MLALALVVSGTRSVTPGGSARHPLRRAFPSLVTAEPPDAWDESAQPAAATVAAARQRPAIAYTDTAVLNTAVPEAEPQPIVRRQKIPAQHEDEPPY